MTNSTLTTFRFDRRDPAKSAAEAKTVLDGCGAVRVADFPTDAERYVKFLAHYGSPLCYY